MLKTVSNGQSIHPYVPRDLQRMFYKNPARVHASHNGLDPYGFSTEGLVLYLPLWALKDSAFKSVDAYRHTCTPSGTTKFWTPTGWDLAGVNEYLDMDSEVASFASLSVGSIGIWFYSTENINFTWLGGGSDVSEAGREFGFYYQTGKIGLQHRPTVSAITDNAVVAVNTWGQMFYTSKAGENLLYINGVNIAALSYATGDATTNSFFSHVGGVDALKWGINEDSGGLEFPFEGILGEIRVYNRSLSAGEVADNYNRTVWRYQ